LPEETAPNKDQAQEQKPAKKGGGMAIGKMLIVVVLAFASSAAGGVVTFLLISKTAMNAQPAGHVEDEKGEAEKIAELLEKGAVLPLEPFVVNLADIEAARYLRIKITLMIDDKEKLSHVVENMALQQKVRDVILQSLTAKTSKDLINEEGKNKLRHELQEKIMVYFHDPKLVDVMFTEFVIQL
jgi:flagellar FliL protein